MHLHFFGHWTGVKMDLCGEETHAGVELGGGVEELVAEGGEAGGSVPEEGRVVSSGVGDVEVVEGAETRRVIACSCGGCGDGEDGAEEEEESEETTHGGSVF